MPTTIPNRAVPVFAALVATAFGATALVATAFVAAVGCPLRATGAPAATAVEDVAFVAANDGSTQRYMMILPPGFTPDEPHDLLVALHGHGSDRKQFAQNARAECRAARDVAAAQRMIFVSPEYRAPASWMSRAAEEDVAQIIGDIKRQCRVGRVILTGASMGGMSSLAFAVRRPDLVDGVASMNGLANLMDYDVPQFVAAITASYGGSKAQIPAEWQARSAELNVPQLTMPVGLTTGGKDMSVPPQSVMRLAAKLETLKRPVRHIHREAGGHSTTYEDATDILEFVITQARQTPAAGKPARRPPVAPAR